ncbi:MAG: hypothetical protein R3282_04470, partial [Rhodothermales bacterium]|nr:hypothetical protein [Rhodothermales bacterium]
GDEAEAYRKAEQALAWAEESKHPFSISDALYRIAAISQIVRRADKALLTAERAASISEKNGNLLWKAASVIVHGWALGNDDSPDAGIERITEGNDNYRMVGPTSGLPYGQAMLAELLALAGRPEQGLAELQKARETYDEYGGYWWSSEVDRLTGQLTMQLENPDRDQAQRWLERAIETARQQEAWLFHLRTSVDLTQLLESSHDDTRALELVRESFQHIPAAGDS